MTDPATAPQKAAGNYLDDIQILRAIAALLVLVDHSWLALHTDRHGGAAANILGDLGTIGVAAFFAISGYIMVHTNMIRFGDWRSSVTFLARRTLRIVPIYYVGTIIAYLTLTHLLGVVITWEQLVKSLLFIPFYGNIENAGFYPVFGVGWTLNMEMFFYVLFAIALLGGRRMGLALLTGAILALALAGIVFRIDRSPTLQESALAFYTGSIMILFAVGALVRWREDLVRAWADRIVGPKRAAWAFPAAMAVPILVAVVFETAGVRSGLPRILQAVSALPLVATICYGIGVGGAARRVMLFLGDASYSMYIFHSLVLLYLGILWTAMELEGSAVLGLANFALSLAGSILGYFAFEQTARRWIEMPCRRWLDQRLSWRGRLAGQVV